MGVFRSFIGSCILSFGLFVHGAAAVPPATPEVLREPLDGPAAAVALMGPWEPDALRPGVQLFVNGRTTAGEVPPPLAGKPMVRTHTDWVELVCTAPGVITLMAEPTRHGEALMAELGFARIGRQTYQLFGPKPHQCAAVYQKRLSRGEHVTVKCFGVQSGYHAVLVGPSRLSAKSLPQRPWPENGGELLYNGIRLPREWPPRVDPRPRDPMPVPYLEHPPEVIPIDVGRQLFVDDFLIEQTTLTRRFHKATKYEGNPILTPETELERNLTMPGAGPKSGGVWWDSADRRFKMWYEAGWLGKMCFASSADGLHWERPELNVKPGTNCVLWDLQPDSTTIFLDPHAEDPSARFKMWLRPPHHAIHGWALVSADGIHWSEPVASGLCGDRSTMFYNPFRKKWVFSIRSTSETHGRNRHYHEHADFLEGAQWKAGEPVFWTAADRLDPPDLEIQDAAQLYNLDAVAYESLMLGVYQIHRGPHNGICYRHGMPKITELTLAYSRDGFHWHRPDREPLIAASRRPGDWERGYVQSVGGVCLIVGDRLYFYYLGYRGDPERPGGGLRTSGAYANGSTGVAFLRRDGFASMEAGAGGGTLTTRPVRFTGSHLWVNLDAPDGELRVEILDVERRPIEPYTKAQCRPVRGNTTAAKVAWNGAPTLESCRDRSVRFRFHLTQGRLYAFWVSLSDDGRSSGYPAAGDCTRPGERS